MNSLIFDMQFGLLVVMVVLGYWIYQAKKFTRNNPEVRNAATKATSSAAIHIIGKLLAAVLKR